MLIQLRSMSKRDLLVGLFDSLAGIWNLSRDLVSANASEPSGKCTGIATFTSRPPSPVIDADGKLDLAQKELLYHERGAFELPTGIKMPFAKKYIWRFKSDHAQSNISIWFTKPGTEAIDYLFHKIDIDFREDEAATNNADAKLIEIRGTGGHPCVDDFYNTTYSFQLRGDDTGTDRKASPQLDTFSTIHEVRGPKKDQVISTTFRRAA